MQHLWVGTVKQTVYLGLFSGSVGVGGQAPVEGDVEGVEGALPALGPPGPALAGGIQGHDGHVDTLQCGLLIGEVASAKLDDYGLFKLVEVKPAGEMTDIRFVTVIKRQERSDGEVTDFEALEESSLDLEALISGEGEEDADFTEE